MAGLQVNIRDLSRTYVKGGKQIQVLRGVDLDLAPGERVSIVGPSGSGKSTFLQILGTLDRPTAGTVQLDGKDVFALPNRDKDLLRNRRIGFVFQFHHLLPDLTALTNVALPLIIQGRPKRQAEEISAARLERVGLGHRLTHRPGELSGGEQQRVALARAMVLDPGMILADEPTGNLDPATSDEVFELLLELNREQGATLVVVTHSQALAQRFERQLRVDEGQLVEVSA